MIKCILPFFKKYSFVQSLFTRNLIYTHRYNHTVTITQIQSHRYNHTDTITQIQSHRQKHRYNHTDRNKDTITQTQRYKNTHIIFMLIRLYICFVRDKKFANKRLA